MTSLFKAIGSALLILGSFFAGPQTTTAPVSQTFGSFTPVGGQTYSLSGAGVTATQSTIPLTSFTTPDGRALTMSMFGAIGYAVIDPNSPTKIEDITFTGVTQNANGTAILTGVSRGMDFVTPYTSSLTLQQAHSGGSYLILSNTAGFYGQQFLFANSLSTSTGGLVFSSTTPPHLDFNPNFSSFPSTTLVSQGYVAALAIAGAAPITTAVAGIGMLSTAAQAAAGTPTGVFNLITYNLLLPSSIATSTCQSAANSVLVSSSTTGKLDGRCLDTTSNSYTWSQPQIFTATTTMATTTIASTTITTANVGTETVLSAITAASTATISGFSGKQALNATTNSIAGNTTSSSTLYTASILGGTIGTANYLEYKVYFTVFNNGSSIPFLLQVGYGTGTTSISSASLGANATSCPLGCSAVADIVLAGAGSTNSQTLLLSFTASSTVSSVSTLAQDSTTAKQIVIEAQFPTNGNNNFLTESLVTGKLEK